ncbi:hypothetical protein VTN02DRAFT_1334 [Thermoascus thermophilus]
MRRKSSLSRPCSRAAARMCSSASVSSFPAARSSCGSRRSCPSLATLDLDRDIAEDLPCSPRLIGSSICHGEVGANTSKAKPLEAVCAWSGLVRDRRRASFVARVVVSLICLGEEQNPIRGKARQGASLAAARAGRGGTGPEPPSPFSPPR